MRIEQKNIGLNLHVELLELTKYLGKREYDEEVEEEASLGLEISESGGARRGVSGGAAGDGGAGEGSFGHFELKPHVPKVEGVGHASENGDGNGEPTVDEQTHTRVAHG